MRPRAAVMATLIVIPLALAGCAPTPVPTPAPTRTAPASPTPTPTPAAERPTPRFDLDCSDLGFEADLAGVLVEPIEERDPIAMYAAVGPDLPRLTFIEALGGLICEWSNGVPHASSTSTPREYVGIELSILPDATELWAKYQRLYELTGDTVSGCNTYPGCSYEQFVNGYWISIRMDNVNLSSPITDAAVLDDVPAAAAFAESVSAKVAALAPPVTAWAPPATTVPMATNCEAIVATESVQAALGIDQPLYFTGPHGGWSSWAGATERTGGGRCAWYLSEQDASLGSMAWLPAGSWAAREVMSLVTVPSAAEPAAVPGLLGGDSAYIRCSTDDGTCYVDLTIGGNWIQVANDGHGGATARTDSMAIAAAVVAGFYGP